MLSSRLTPSSVSASPWDAWTAFQLNTGGAGGAGGVLAPPGPPTDYVSAAQVPRSLPGSLQPVLKAREVELGKEEIKTRSKGFRKGAGALSRKVLDPTNAVQQESALNIAKA
mgnify:CR=1 FL=1